MKNKDELVTAVFERIREQKEARTKSRRRALLIVVTLAFTAAIGVFAVIAFRPERAPGPAFPAEQSAVSQEEASATASAASSEAGSAVPADMSKDEPQPEGSGEDNNGTEESPADESSGTEENPGGESSGTEENPGGEISQDHGNESEPPEPFGELPDSFAEHEAVLRPLLAGTLAKPVFPAERTGITKEAATGLENCFSAMTRQFLSSPDGKNKVYSPLNIYFALAMLAETAKGDTRAQIASLLGAESMDSLREQARALWENHYRDKENSRILLGSSLWLNNDDTVQYDSAVVDLLARIYYASVFSGDPTDPEFSAQYREWINKNTFDLLKDKVDNNKLPEEMRFGICTTAYYKSSWIDAFDYLKPDQAPVFHAPDKEITGAEFMYSEWNSMAQDSFYIGDSFKAMSKSLDRGKMYFILPDEGFTPEGLIADGEALAYISGVNGRKCESTALAPGESCICRLTLPAFEAEYDLDLIEGLKMLGVTDCFDPEKSDLSALLKGTTRVIDQANHSAKVIVNEKGVEAAAYTELTAPDSEPPEDCRIYELTLDRPFIFVISVDGSPMFVGVVNDPTAE